MNIENQIKVLSLLITSNNLTSLKLDLDNIVMLREMGNTEFLPMGLNKLSTKVINALEN